MLRATFALAVAKMLEDCTRTGTDLDLPEGSRVITISDTLAKTMTQMLRCEGEYDHFEIANNALAGAIG